MGRYFAIRIDGDLAETQRIYAVAGHARLATQAYSACARRSDVRNAETFFSCLRKLLYELCKLGYTKSKDRWAVTGGKSIPLEQVSGRQFFGTFASVQQAVGKWVYNHLINDLDLFDEVQQNELVFKANDVGAVMELLFDLFTVGHSRNGAILQLEVDSQDPQFFQNRVLKCLSK
jgi:hypothetical protein